MCVCVLIERLSKKLVLESVVDIGRSIGGGFLTRGEHGRLKNRANRVGLVGE